MIRVVIKWKCVYFVSHLQGQSYILNLTVVGLKFFLLRSHALETVGPSYSCEQGCTLTINERGSKGANRPNSAGHNGTPATLNHQAAAN